MNYLIDILVCVPVCCVVCLTVCRWDHRRWERKRHDHFKDILKDLQ
jgi:hypothetical protein